MKSPCRFQETTFSLFLAILFSSCVEIFRDKSLIPKGKAYKKIYLPVLPNGVKTITGMYVEAVAKRLENTPPYDVGKTVIDYAALSDRAELEDLKSLDIQALTEEVILERMSKIEVAKVKH